MYELWFFWGGCAVGVVIGMGIFALFSNIDDVR